MATATTLPALNGHGEHEVLAATPIPRAQGYSLADIQLMAETVARSGIFPCAKTPQAAFALMLLCQSEGIHPMKAMQRYHIIEGKPSKQANAMLGDFLKCGGRVEWGERTNVVVTATFSHPQGGTLTVTWDIEQAKNAGLAGKDNWRKYPRQMLTARVISEGVRAVFPDAVSGLYTPEEVMDFDGPPAPAVQATYVPKNESGHGRGQYASQPQIDAYMDALRGFVEKQNGEWEARWADRLTAFGEDIPNVKIPELINVWQANNHLLRWAVESGRLDASIVPEDAKTRQPAQYLAIVFHRDADYEAMADEMNRYVVEQAERKTVAFLRQHPELDPDGEWSSAPAPKASPAPKAAAAPSDEDDAPWEEGRE